MSDGNRQSKTLETQQRSPNDTFSAVAGISARVNLMHHMSWERLSESNMPGVGFDPYMLGREPTGMPSGPEGCAQEIERIPMQGRGFEPEGIPSRHMSFLPAQILDPQSEGRLGLKLRALSAQADDRSNPTPSSTGGFGPDGARCNVGSNLKRSRNPGRPHTCRSLVCS